MVFIKDRTCGHQGSPSNQTSKLLRENFATSPVLSTPPRRLCGGALHLRQVCMQNPVSGFDHELYCRIDGKDTYMREVIMELQTMVNYGMVDMIKL